MNSKSKRMVKVLGGAIVGGALLMIADPASADGDINIGVGELQECTISKSMDSSSTKLVQFAINGNSSGDVDGRDFLVWQRGTSPVVGGGDLADWQTNYGTGY